MDTNEPSTRSRPLSEVLAGDVGPNDSPASMLSAELTDFNLVANPEDAPSAPFRLKHDAPWRRVAIRYLRKRAKSNKRGCYSLRDLYRRMGWSDQQAYWRRRTGHLTLKLAAQMALALDADLGAFLAELAREEGIPEVYERVIQKPNARPRQPVSSQRCSVCGELGHRKDSPKCLLRTNDPDPMKLLTAQSEAERLPRRPERDE